MLCSVRFLRRMYESIAPKSVHGSGRLGVATSQRYSFCAFPVTFNCRSTLLALSTWIPGIAGTVWPP